MKGLKKLTLASAIAAAPFASQALEALDDATMGDVTGQAGVTVEINIGGSGISVGEIEYQDEGSVLIQNVTVNNVNGLTQEIDVDANGNLVMSTTPLTGVQLAIGDTVADEMAVNSAVALQSTSGEVTELVNNLNMTVNLGQSDTTIMNLAAAGNTGVGGAVTDAIADGFGAEAFQSSVAIRSTSSVEITDLDVGMFGYTQQQALTRAGLATADLVDATGANAGDVNNTLTTHLTGTLATSGAGATAYTGAITSLNTAVATANDGGTNHAVQVDSATGVVTVVDNDNGGADVTASYGDAATANTNAGDFVAVRSARIANGANESAIQIENVRFYGTGGPGTAATIDQVIWAQGGSSAEGGGVYIQMGQIQGTLEVGGVVLGGESIGTVRVSNINLAGMTQRIYGHP